MAKAQVEADAPTTVNSSVRKTRKYLTPAEVERLMAAARKSGRYGHRDATMILIAFRHGLRAFELCDLQWHQVELAAGRLHVRHPCATHPERGSTRARAARACRRSAGRRREVHRPLDI
jgi:integrase